MKRLVKVHRNEMENETNKQKILFFRFHLRHRDTLESVKIHILEFEIVILHFTLSFFFIQIFFLIVVPKSEAHEYEALLQQLNYDEGNNGNCICIELFYLVHTTLKTLLFNRAFL